MSNIYNLPFLKIAIDEYGISISFRKSIVFGESIWSKLYDLIHRRRFPVFILGLFIPLPIIFMFRSVFDSNSLGFSISFSLFILIMSLMAFVIIRIEFKYNKKLDSKVMSWSEYFRLWGGLPHRWRKEWVKALDSEDLLKYIDQIFDNLKVVITTEGNYFYVRHRRIRFRELHKNIVQKLPYMGLKYKSYPMSYLMLLGGIPDEYIMLWDGSEADMAEALRLYIDGFDSNVIAVAGKNDIDPELMKYLTEGDDKMLLAAQFRD